MNIEKNNKKWIISYSDRKELFKVEFTCNGITSTMYRDYDTIIRLLNRLEE